jgi:uncharacterized protein involved in exopolysaccharide biosynthesis
MSEQILDLNRIGEALWRSRWRILVVVFLSGTVGLGLSFLRSDEYTANSVLFIQDIRIGAMRVSQEEKETAPETFLHFLTNDYTLHRVIKECLLAKRPQHYTIGSLRDRVNARVGRNASTIELSVTMPSDELALRVARSLIDQATRFSEELIRRDVVASQRLIQEQRNELEDALRLKAAAWQEVLERSRLESDLQRIGQFEVALRNMIDDLNMTTATMRQKRAEYESLLAEIRDQSSTMVVRQSLVESPALVEITRALTGDDVPSNILDLQLDSEIRNPVYEELRVEVAKATAEYEGRRARADEIERRIESLHREIDQTQTRYSQAYPQALRLEKEFNAAQLALTDVVQTYARAASEVFWERQRLRVVPPVRPDAPSGPNRIVIAFAAALFGGFLAVFVVIARIPRREIIGTAD